MYTVYQLIIACLVGYTVGWVTMIVYYKVMKGESNR